MQSAKKHVGEAKNALARAVFFNRLGELRDRTFENQRYRASGLNLVVDAIVLWNTVYMNAPSKGFARMATRFKTRFCLICRPWVGSTLI
jgi:hypothetical protein